MVTLEEVFERECKKARDEAEAHEATMQLQLNWHDRLAVVDTMLARGFKLDLVRFAFYKPN